MKKLLLLLTFFLSSSAFAQKMPFDYFKEADSAFNAEKYEKALPLYQYIVDNHPRNELYASAFYNVGNIYFLQKNYEKAIPILKTILISDFNEEERSGGGIMADPYANFKHRACEILSDIYFSKEMFDTALHYFALSDTTYPYLHFCGNAYASNDVRTALRYSQIYTKLNQPDKAIDKLLQAVFINLANNSEVIEELKKLLSNKKNLVKELDSSLDNIYSKTIKTKSSTYTQYYSKFLNSEIAVPNGYEDEKTKFDKEKSIKKIKQSNFYKMIENLQEQK